MTDIDKIKETMKEIRSQYPEFFRYKGFVYCGYFSQLLHDRLKKHGVKTLLLFGEYLSKSRLALSCKENVEKLVKTISDENDPVYGDIKRLFVKRGNKLPERTGHAVVFFEDEVFDITSEQFGLPEQYPFYQFVEIWEKRYTGKITITDDPSCYGPETKIPFMYYQEAPDSTVSSEGKEYNLNILFKEVLTKKLTMLPVSVLKWILDYTKVDKDRLALADLSQPLLVCKDNSNERWIVLDGAHRLTKAVREGVKTLSAHIVTEVMLEKALISNKNKSVQKQPLYNDWK